MALKTDFGWVLSGAVNNKKQKDSETCCLTTLGAGSGIGQDSRFRQNIHAFYKASSTPFTKGTTILKSRPAFARRYVRGATEVLLQLSVFGI